LIKINFDARKCVLDESTRATVIAAPAPWRLAGDGYIWIFRFPRAFVEREGFLSDWQSEALVSTLGAVMLIDYLESDVGPYRELLFIPGRVNVAGRGMFTISKIYVSTAESVVNGLDNWGIPKQLAAFDRASEGDGSERFGVNLEGREIFTARLAPFGPRFPFVSALLPLAVGQERRGDLLITRPKAVGTGRLCRARDVHAAAAYFPDIARMKPIAVIAVRDFRMTFPVPQIVPGFFGQAR
jgi:hypothetical protein